MVKTAFISGSTRGIGQAIAMEMALNDFTVILNGKKETRESQELLKRIIKISPQSDVYYFDVSNSRQVDSNCNLILKKYGSVDVLVNNAGILRDKTLLNMTYKEWDEVIKTNIYGAFLITKKLAPSMVKKNHGRIINISSVIGLIGNYGQSNYSASKSALIGFTKSLAKEFAKYNITVNAVCPGLVDTQIIKNVPQPYIDKLLEKIPLRRAARPEEVAKLVVFLASESGDYITGDVININGGWL